MPIAVNEIQTLPATEGISILDCQLWVVACMLCMCDERFCAPPFRGCLPALPWVRGMVCMGIYQNPGPALAGQVLEYLSSRCG